MGPGRQARPIADEQETRDTLTVVGPGWEEVAGAALGWAVENGTGNARKVP